MSDKPARKALMYSDLADDGDKRQRRIVYSLSTRFDNAVDLTLQWKRFLSQERYTEETITSINQVGLRLLLEATLRQPIKITNSLDAEIAERVIRKVGFYIADQLTQYDKDHHPVVEADDTYTTVMGFNCLCRGISKGMDGWFEVDIRFQLNETCTYAEITSLEQFLVRVLRPESSCVHDVGYDKGITFWQSFELPVKDWVL